MKIVDKYIEINKKVLKSRPDFHELDLTVSESDNKMLFVVSVIFFVLSHIIFKGLYLSETSAYIIILALVSTILPFGVLFCFSLQKYLKKEKKMKFFLNPKFLSFLYLSSMIGFVFLPKSNDFIYTIAISGLMLFIGLGKIKDDIKTLTKEEKELLSIESEIKKLNDKEIYNILKYSENLQPYEHMHFYPIYEKIIKKKYLKVDHLDVVHLRVKSQVNQLKINH